MAAAAPLNVNGMFTQAFMSLRGGGPDQNKQAFKNLKEVAVDLRTGVVTIICTDNPKGYHRCIKKEDLQKLSQFRDANPQLNDFISGIVKPMIDMVVTFEMRMQITGEKPQIQKTDDGDVGMHILDIFNDNNDDSTSYIALIAMREFLKVPSRLAVELAKTVTFDDKTDAALKTAGGDKLDKKKE